MKVSPVDEQFDRVQLSGSHLFYIY